MASEHLARTEPTMLWRPETRPERARTPLRRGSRKEAARRVHRRWRPSPWLLATRLRRPASPEPRWHGLSCRAARPRPAAPGSMPRRRRQAPSRSQQE
eukprot:4893065-Prymnesium_polylepis.2